jgi:glyoxylase-like metal-dependent hydrolase (beta-lactamase superfamily II)/ferredoxin
MASPEQRLATNVPGPFFVDATCIDCDTCRWMAPAVFDRAGDQARVHTQPSSDGAAREALHALVSCPTASIGVSKAYDPRTVLDDFPLPVDGPVYHCGYHHESSFGAASYLVVRPEGNVLVDSPRFARPLVRRLEAMGGVRWLFLTHRDDIADHRKFRDHFGCERILHRADIGPGTRDAEHVLDGEDPIPLEHDLLIIPVPGHTLGSCCLLVQGRYLFTGDHLAYSATLDHLYAFRSSCWYDWDALKRSMGRLADHPFEWVLPGHGRRAHYPGSRMAEEMARCLAWL